MHIYTYIHIYRYALILYLEMVHVSAKLNQLEQIVSFVILVITVHLVISVQFHVIMVRVRMASVATTHVYATLAGQVTLTVSPVLTAISEQIVIHV